MTPYTKAAMPMGKLLSQVSADDWVLAPASGIQARRTISGPDENTRHERLNQAPAARSTRRRLFQSMCLTRRILARLIVAVGNRKNPHSSQRNTGCQPSATADDCERCPLSL